MSAAQILRDLPGAADGVYWIGATDSLAGTAALNTAQATIPLAAVDRTVPFASALGDFPFLTGDCSALGACWRAACRRAARPTC